MAPNCRRILATFSFLLIASALVTGQTPPAKQPKITASHREWKPSPQELLAPYWTLEPGWSTELELRNNVPWHDLRITPVLHTADGVEVPLAAVDLKPEEVVSVNLREAVASVKSELLDKMGAFGSVVFRFDGTGAANGFAAAMVRRNGHPIDFHFDADDMGSSAAEGIWWLPAESSTAYLILSNPTNKPITGALSLTDASGTAHRLSIEVGPRQSVRTNIREALRNPANGALGGLSLSTDQKEGLLATEIVFDEVTGLATIMKLFDRQPVTDFDTVESRVLRAPMIALSQPDPSLGFPNGTILDPKIFLRYAGPIATVISPFVNWRTDTKSGTSPLPPIKVSPGQMKIVSLADFQKTGQIPADATWATVSLGFKGRTGDLVAVTMSYDKTARYGLQTPFSEGTNGLLKGSMWHVDSTHNSLITTGNGGTEDTRAQVTLFYNGGQGKYRLEQRLSPGQQIWLNLAELVRNQIPDSDGKTIPPDVMFGSYELRDLDHHAQGLLYEGKVVVDKTYGHASYGCAHCCGFSSAQVSPLPFSGPPGINNTDTYQAFGVCQSSWEDFDFATNWQSSNTAVATLPSYTLHTVAVGTARGSARNTLAYQQYVGYPCPNEPMVGQQPVQVSYPTITSMDPNPIMVGTSPPDGKLTITGIGFGTSPSVTLPAGVSSSGQASTGTQIILTGVTVAVSAIVGNNNVTVTANGVPSSPATLTIDGPYHMIVQDDRTGPCSGCQTTVRRLVTYQIQNFSGTNAGVLNLGEDISFSSWNCQQSWPGASTNSCATNPATTLSSGIFTDGWTLGSDAFTPAGCGNNVIDHWQWCGHSPAQTLGTLTGYQHTDHISINGVVSPATMTYGTVVPF